jgi:hypothetical protein
MEYTTLILKINQHVSMTTLHSIIITYICTNQAHKSFPEWQQCLDTSYAEADNPESFHSFPSSLQANSKTVRLSQIRPLVDTSSPIRYSLIITQLYPIWALTAH